MMPNYAMGRRCRKGQHSESSTQEMARGTHVPTLNF